MPQIIYIVSLDVDGENIYTGAFSTKKAAIDFIVNDEYNICFSKQDPNEIEKLIEREKR